MRLSRWISSFGLLSVMALSDGCAPAKDWTSPEYIANQVKEGDERAFAELARLTPEQQKALVPALIEAYNTGKKPQRAIEALASIGDPAAKEALGAALTQSDDMLAGLAARGLGNIGDKGSAAAIAKRLGEVTTDEAYPAFFEALSKLPIDAAADALSAVLMRPASKIGGAGSVRLGCRALGETSAPTDVILDALVFGLVNFTPTPFKDPMPDCELALLKLKDAAIPKLVELFEGKNAKVNDHLKVLSYPAVTGQLRAAAVLAHSQNPAAIKAITQFVSKPHPIPTAELAAMPIADQQNFYANSGQMFDQAAKALGAAGGPENLATLRKLENASEGSLLANFSEWFALSDGAEVGLRQSVHESLAVIGDASDRKLLWDRATAGTVGRGATTRPACCAPTRCTTSAARRVRVSGPTSPRSSRRRPSSSPASPLTRSTSSSPTSVRMMLAATRLPSRTRQRRFRTRPSPPSFRASRMPRRTPSCRPRLPTSARPASGSSPSASAPTRPPSRRSSIT